MVKCCRGKVKGAMRTISICQSSASPKTKEKHTLIYTVTLKFCTKLSKVKDFINAISQIPKINNT